jgi:16S rRNA (cytosine1402-N4)-methyltransferase
MTEHIPVMLDEMLSALQVVPGGSYADVTYGRGGYASAIYKISGVKLFASDRDDGSVTAGERDGAVEMHHAKFSQLSKLIKPQSLDGVVADLGVSSPQIDNPQRGFSFMSDGPLDMRMGLCDQSALELLSQVSEEELVRILRTYGEEPRARSVARALIERCGEIRTTQDLVRVVSEKTWHHKRHPATRVFQALRIAVNDELRELDCLLKSVRGWIKPGGRAVFVSFHSLEDRMIKHELKSWGGDGGRVFPSDQEVLRNPRARSAVLRWKLVL